VPDRLRKVAVIGNGIMGHGIAQVFAVAGKEVSLVGRQASSLERARARIEESLDLFVEHGLLDGEQAAEALGRVSTTTSLDDGADAELVVEAVPEDTELKLEVFRRLDEICPPATVLASSSGRPASSLSARVRNRGRLLATHFWNPAQLLPLVEVCGGPETRPEVIDWTCSVLREAGKAPVVIEREIDGFIGNRLQFALLREALHLWAEGFASAEAIDTAVKTSFGRRLQVTGPLESAQLGGLGTMYEFGRFLFPSLSNESEPPPRMREAAENGDAGRGMYDWSSADREQLLRRRYEELFRLLRNVDPG
jgi:3-hydroxybutyryl-CoA dehydrogenase